MTGPTGIVMKAAFRKVDTVPKTTVCKLKEYSYEFLDVDLAPGVYEWKFQLCYAADQSITGLPASDAEVKLLDCVSTLQITVKAGKPVSAVIASRDGEDGIVGTNEDALVLLATLLDSKGREVPAELDFVARKTWQISVPEGMAWGTPGASAVTEGFLTIPSKCVSVFERKYVRITDLKLLALKPLQGVRSVPIVLKRSGTELPCGAMKVAALRATNVQLLCDGVPLTSAKNMTALGSLTARLMHVHDGIESPVSFEYRPRATRPTVTLTSDAFDVKTVKVCVYAQLSRQWRVASLVTQVAVELDGTAQFDDVSVKALSAGPAKVTVSVCEGKAITFKEVVPLEVLASGLPTTMELTLGGEVVSMPLGGTATLSVTAGALFAEASFACTDETGAVAGPTHVRVMTGSTGSNVVGTFEKHGAAYQLQTAFAFPTVADGRRVLLRFETKGDDKRHQELGRCARVYNCGRVCAFLCTCGASSAAMMTGLRPRRVTCIIVAGPVDSIRASCERARCGVPLTVSAECIDAHGNRAVVEGGSGPLQAMVTVPPALSVWSGDHQVPAMEALEMVIGRVPGCWKPKRAITIKGRLPVQVCECAVRVTGGGAPHGGRAEFVIGAGAPCAVRISPATQSVRDGDDDDDAGPRFVIALKDEWGNDVPREGVEMSYQVDGKPAAAAKAGEKRGADGKAKGDSSSKSELLGKQLAEGDACGDTPDGALKVKLPAKMFPRGEHEVQFYVRGVKGVAGCVGCSSDTVRVMTILCVRLHVCMCV